MRISDWSSDVCASHEALVQQGSISTARCLARRWKAANLPLFRRLTLHAATNPEADDLDLGIETLLDGPRPALWDPICKREALRFMRKDRKSTRMNSSH